MSDLFGERSILLGAVHGIVEALYRRYLDDGATPEDAFDRACESLTGPIRETISKQGLIAVDEQLTPDGRRDFRRAYDVTYAAFKGLMAEVYDEVVSGNEIRSVVAAAARFDRFPMTKVEGSPMWQTGSTVRRRRGHREPPIDGFTAGTYCGAMMAHAHRERPSLLGDRQRVDHRGRRLAAPLHARARGRLHGRQLLDDGAARHAQVGTAVSGDAGADRVPERRIARRNARRAARGIPDAPCARGATPAGRDAPGG